MSALCFRTFEKGSSLQLAPRFNPAARRFPLTRHATSPIYNSDRQNVVHYRVGTFGFIVQVWASRRRTSRHQAQPAVFTNTIRLSVIRSQVLLVNIYLQRLRRVLVTRLAAPRFRRSTTIVSAHFCRRMIGPASSLEHPG